MNSVTTLYDFAVELLDESIAALNTTTAGAPERAFVGVALPALDCCPQLSVHVQGLGLDNTSPTSPATVVGSRTPRDGQVNLASFWVTIVRCTPQPSGGDLTPPSPSALQGASLTILEDLWALWNWLTNRIRTKPGLWEGKCMATYLDSAIPLDESGGCAGWQIPIRTSIQGYNVGI